MSFDVFLIASSTSPDGAQARVATDRALAACGARRGRHGEFDFMLANGGGQEFYGEDDDTAGGMFALRGISPEVVQLIFAIADATRCFIIFPGEEPVALRTPSNDGELVGAEDLPIERIADAQALAKRLGDPFGDWADYAGSITSGAAVPDSDEHEADDVEIEIDPTLLDRFFKRPNKD